MWRWQVPVLGGQRSRGTDGLSGNRHQDHRLAGMRGTELDVEDPL